MMKLLQHFKELTVRPQNTQELKGLILQLALRGRLTDKFSFKRKKEEKDLVEGYFKLPDDWYWDKFANICEFQMGKTPPSKELEYWEGDYPWISIADMDTYATIYETKKTLSAKGLTCFNNGLVKKGTLIMSFKLTIGKTSILGVDACHNEAIISIYPNKKVLQEYLFLFLPIISNWGTKVNALMGNTLNKGKIQNMNLPIPPLEEQKEIVKVVETLFKEVEQLEQLTVARISLKEDFVTSALHQLTTNNANQEWTFLQDHFKSFFNETTNIKKLRETVLQLAVQGRLTANWREQRTLSGAEVEDASILLKRIKQEKAQLIADKKIKKEKALPPITKDEIPYELPEGWVWCRLEDLTSITGGVTKGKRNQTDLINTPYLRVANVQRGFLNLELMKEILVTKTDFQKYQLKKDDLLMIEGGDPDKVGRCAIWSSEIPGCIYQNHVFRVRPYIEATMNNHYFMQFINSRFTRDYYESCAKRTTNLASINKTQMRSTPIAFPPLEEQKAIVEKVNALMGLCDSLEQEVQQSQEHSEKIMQSCLREVFEGAK